VATFNEAICAWEVSGDIPEEPTAVNCWDDFEFNTTTCVWENIGVEPLEPAAVNCWDAFVFNTATCAWDNTGVQPEEPTAVNCWDDFEFNTTTCVWENTGVQPTVSVDTRQACGSFTWIDGNTYSSSNNTATYTIQNEAGCDSIVTLNLTVNSSSQSAQTITILEGESFTLPDGVAVSSIGIYTSIIFNQSGCDSTITTNLIVLTGNSVTQNVSICAGDSFMLPDGVMINSAGLYTSVIPADNGADSTIFTLLSLNPTSQIDIYEDLCSGESYALPNGQSVNTDGDYTLTELSAFGCDSITIYHVTFHPSTTAFLSEVICSGESYTLPDGVSVNISGTYPVTVLNESGCDSLITLQLVVLPQSSAQVSVTICAQDSYVLPDGISVSQEGVYTSVIPNAAGCDSVITTAVQVIPVSNVTVNASICNGQEFALPNGTSVNVSGTYVFEFLSQLGCDSIVTVILDVVETIELEEDAVICSSETYTLPDGSLVNTAGDYVFTAASSGGCDSIYTLHLFVVQPSQANQMISLCSGDAYTLPDGSVVQNGGVYTSTIENFGGCDSTVTTTITIVQTTYQFVQASICQGDSYQLPNGQSISTAGSYPITLSSAAGCDSVVTTTLAVINALQSSQSISICQGEYYALPDGIQVFNEGTYQSVLTASTGCDSIVTTTIILLPNYTIAWDATICAGESYTLPDGTSTGVAGNYVFNFDTSTGCDSMVVVNLSVVPALQTQQNVVICAGDSYVLPDGNSVNASGNYLISEISTSGCDSTINFVVEVVNEFNVSETVHICSNDSYTLPDGTLVNLTGVYTSSLLSQAGCDSLVSTTLVVHPIASPTIVAHICSDETYTLPNGQVVNLTGSYPVTLQTSTGCDSIVTIQLNVHMVPNAVQVLHEICPDETITLQNGQVVSNSGMYAVTLSTAWGCDSLIQNIVLVYPEYNQSMNVTICASESYTLPNGQVISQPGTYTSNLQTSHGCDSTITTVVNVLPVYSQNMNVTICYNEVYALPDGTSAAATGAYEINYTASSGCDSTVVYFINVNDQVQSNIQDYVCSGESYLLPDGTQVSQTGSYTTILPASVGCDSLIVINLIALNPIQSFDQTTICEGSMWTLPDGIQVGLAGIYESVLTSIQTGCDSLVFTAVAVDPAIEVAITPIQDTIQICAGDTTSLFGSGATNVFWSADPGSLSAPNQPTTTAYPASSEMVYLIGTTGVCQHVDSVFIDVMPLPDLQIEAESNELCLGDSILLAATGGDSYTWLLDESLTCLTCSENTVSPTVTTPYTVIATLGMCSATNTFILDVSPNPLAGIQADTIICEGDQIYLMASGGDQYLWSTGDTAQLTLVQPYIDMTYELIASLGICQDTTTIDIQVIPIPDVYAGADTLISLGASVELLGVADGEPLWTASETLSCLACENPLATPTQTSEYCLSVVNEFGCINSDCVRVEVQIECESFFIPNAFAPEMGGDANNDCFKAFGMECFAEMKLMVFDRWGQVVFKTENPDDCWDGMLNEKPLNTGVYVYRFEGVLINGVKFEKNGNVTLIRL
jgi:gliding motility-associated-like protein